MTNNLAIFFQRQFSLLKNETEKMSFLKSLLTLVLFLIFSICCNVSAQGKIYRFLDYFFY